VPLGFRPAHGIASPLVLDIDGETVELRIEHGPDGVRVSDDDTTVAVQLRGVPPRMRAAVDGHERPLQVHQGPSSLHLRWGGRTHEVSLFVPGASDDATGGDGAVRMPMSGQVLSVDVVQGQQVEAGQVLATVEAMKLETPLRAAIAGTVATVHAQAGQSLPTGTVVVTIEPVAPEEAP
jgi:acetyl/propionyl-CoA carboxylase alpha subunit